MKTKGSSKTIRQFLTAIIPLLLLSACASNAPFDQSASYTLSTGSKGKVKAQGLSVSHADLTFIIHPQQKRIEGLAALSLSTHQPIQTIYIDLDSRFIISSIQLGSKTLNREEFTHENGLITLLSNEQVAGEFTVTIRYQGAPRIAVRAPWDGGFVWSKTPTG